jgi:hypothetical protein
MGRLDALADRLAVVDAELRAHEDPAVKAAAVEQDAEGLVAAAVAGGSAEPTKAVTAWELRLRDLRTEHYFADCSTKPASCTGSTVLLSFLSSTSARMRIGSRPCRGRTKVWPGANGIG